MKIYFCGAHAVGKSTLARFVSNNYQLPMITESARMILSEQELQIDSLRYDIKSANEYQKQVFRRQIQEEEKYDSFVSDRSLVDVLAYSAQHTYILSDLFYSPDLTTYLEKLREKDTYIFFVRPSKATLRADGVREQINWDGIIAIDAMIKLLIKMWDLRYFQISTDSMQERVDLISAVLSQK